MHFWILKQKRLNKQEKACLARPNAPPTQPHGSHTHTHQNLKHSQRRRKTRRKEGGRRRNKERKEEEGLSKPFASLLLVFSWLFKVSGANQAHKSYLNSSSSMLEQEMKGLMDV